MEAAKQRRRGAALVRWLPIAGWLPGYGGDQLRADLVAGATTAVMLIPQAMGYALLAGLPPIVGLYAALVPPVAYALFGTSRPLAVGPVAMDSLLVAVAVGGLAAQGSDDYLALATTLMLMVGAIQLLLGLLGMGFVVNFLSRPVISGFTSAAALIIGMSQLRHLVQLDLPRTHALHRIAAEAVAGFDRWHLIALGLGLGNVVLLVLLRRLAPRLPRAMIAVSASTVLAWSLALAERGLAIVGDVPAGLPPLSPPALDPATLSALLPSAATIALVAFIEAVSVGKHFARRDRYEIRPGQELIALGAANTAGSLFGGYPVTGGFSRTAVNAQAGARTPLAGVFTALVVGATLAWLTPLFHFMPKAALSAIIMTAVLGLFDAQEPRRLWSLKRADFWLLAATFGSTLVFGIQQGILIGVGVSVLSFVVGTTRPHFAVLGQVPGTEAYLNVKRHPHVVTHPGVIIVRIDAQFYFGNVSFLKDTLRELEAAMSEPLTAVVLDMSGVNQLDSSAEDGLSEIERDYRERDVLLVLSHVKGPVRDVMLASGLLARLDEERRLFLRTHDAVQRALGEGTLPAGGQLDDDSDPRAPADRIGCGPPLGTRARTGS